MSSKSNGRICLTRNSTPEQANQIPPSAGLSKKSPMETDVSGSTSGGAPPLDFARGGELVGPHILVVDDEEYICEVIKEMLADANYRVQMACDPQKAMDILEREPVDFVLTDLIMGEKSGVDVLNKTIKLHPDAVVVLMTGRPTIENAVAVLKSGAYDYLIKPFSMDTLRAVIKRGLEKQRLLRENINLKETV